MGVGEDETLTDPGMVEEQVQSRATIDLRRIPQDDATHEIRELGRFLVLTIRGRVNESFPGATIGEKLTAPVVFDLTEVDRITSFGVRSWLQMFDVFKARLQNTSKISKEQIVGTVLQFKKALKTPTVNGVIQKSSMLALAIV